VGNTRKVAAAPTWAQVVTSIGGKDSNQMVDVVGALVCVATTIEAVLKRLFSNEAREALDSTTMAGTRNSGGSTKVEHRRWTRVTGGGNDLSEPLSGGLRKKGRRPHKREGCLDHRILGPNISQKWAHVDGFERFVSFVVCHWALVSWPPVCADTLKRLSV
jgi:hypothetical protein